MQSILIAAFSSSLLMFTPASGRPHAGVGIVADDPVQPFFRVPDMPAIPGVRTVPGLPQTRSPGATPGVNTPLVPPTAKAAPPAPQTRAETLDDLFKRLAGAGDSEEADGVARKIESVWLHSGSDTADLLMNRAATVLASGQTDIAFQLFDKLVTLDPDWVEAWNKRATLRFLNNDDFGAMEDIAHVLTLEPRHFGALSGMAIILERSGMKKEALATLRKTAAIYPHNRDLQKLIDNLTPEVEGRPI